MTATDTNANAATQSRTIAGKTVTIPMPFAAGHVLNDNEASALNQVYAEDVGNNLRTQVQKAIEEGKSDTEIQTLVDNYVAEYKLRERRGGGRIMDPVEREARSIAEEAVKRALKRKNITISSVAKETFDKLVADHAATDAVQREAKRRVKEAEKVGEISVDDLDLGGGDEEPETQAAAE